MPNEVKVRKGTMRRTLAKVPTAKNVVEESLARIRRVYELFDHVAVAFSGGKDSTVVMNLTTMVAKELGKTPVRVIFWDEEVIPLQTVAFCERTRAREDVAFEWLCIPTAYHNSASLEEPIWYPWGPEYRDKWVREMPEGAITSLPGHPVYPKEERGFHMNNNGYLFDPAIHGSAVMLMGIRAAESVQRTRAVLGRFTESWLQDTDLAVKGTLVKGYPIYDWRTDDVWKAIADFGWDYNEAYDAMNMVGISPHNQRISSPFHVEATRNLPIYAAAYPEIYDKMLDRVPGARTAARYAAGELFGRGGVLPPKPKRVRWIEWIADVIRRHPEERQKYLAKRIAGELRKHFMKTDEPVIETEPHPVTGLSWKWLLKLAIQDDWINRHTPILVLWDEKTLAKKRGRYNAELAAIKAEGRYEEIRP